MSANNVGRSSFFEMTSEHTRASTQDLSHIHAIYAGKLLNIYLIVIDIKTQTIQVLYIVWSIWLSNCFNVHRMRILKKINDIILSFVGEERPYNCELCKKGFLGKTHLVTHFRRYHHDLGAHQIDTLLSFMLKSERYKPS